MYVAETITNEAGDMRARVILDEYANDSKPDGCYFATVYSLDDRGAGADVLGQDSCVKSDLSGELAALWEETRDMEDVEAVLRDQANICAECGEFIKRDTAFEQSEWRQAADYGCEDDSDHEPRYDFSDNPVVGFNYIERSDHKIVNIVTLADLKHWGFESVEDYRKTAGHDDPSHGNLTEWEAWADGDVYYVVVERMVVEHTEITSLDGTVVLQARTSTEVWAEDDDLFPVHGFYGTEYATEFAREQLSAAVGN